MQTVTYACAFVLKHQSQHNHIGSICYVFSIAKDTMYVTTPPMNETTGNLPIELEIAHNGSRIKTNRVFDYRSNPVFTDITPTNHLIV